MTAREAMTPAPLTVTPRTSVAAALRLSRDNRIRQLPVVERGLIVGVVRQEGLLALTPSEATTLSRHELHDALDRLTVERAVEPALTLPAATPLAEAARRLLQEGAHEALVVEAERLVGILTHSDLLRALVVTPPEAVA
ncbi:MAG: CBS domain-containing protein [Candidatus Rokuibacteriota bacterium]